MKPNNHSQFMKLYKYLGLHPWCMHRPFFPHVNVSCLRMKFRLLEKKTIELQGFSEESRVVSLAGVLGCGCCVVDGRSLC